MEQLIAGIDGCKKVLFVDEAEKVNAPLCQATGNLFYANVLPAKVSPSLSILLFHFLWKKVAKDTVDQEVHILFRQH